MSSSACTRDWELGPRFSLEILDERPGFLCFRAEGPRAVHLFRLEPCGHRWQRIPPNDKKGRVQTSTVSVAVMREPTEQELRLPDRDLQWKACRGSGAGGQNRNKVNSAVQLKHLPTGLAVRCETERSQVQNQARALGLLRAKLEELARSASSANENARRRGQVGSGMRGDKVRTVRVQENVVTHHATGKQISLRDYEKGRLELLE